jgi:tetratricopeptide (TPR) repeat protein
MRGIFFVLSVLAGLAWPALATASDLNDCRQQDELDKSIGACTRLVESNTLKDRLIGLLGRGASYFKKGEYDRAGADFDEVIRTQPGFAAAYSLRGMINLAKYDYDRAISDCSRGASLNAQEANTHYCLAVAYYRTSEYGRAIAASEQAIELKPKDAAKFYYLQGFIYHDKAEYDRALVALDEAVRLDPKSGASYVARGRVYDKQGQHDRAAADYDRAIALFDESIAKKQNEATAYADRGFAYQGKGDHGRAIADLDQALRLNPNDADAYGNRGWSHEQKGDLNRAIADYGQALRLDSYLREARDRRNDALAKLNDRASVKEALASPASAKAAGEPEKARPAIPMGRRVALAMGNGGYKTVGRLPNPTRDVAAVAAQLKKIGFEVIDRYDLDEKAMRSALREFESKVAGADWALVYYAGHGMEMDGRNWLIPVDASLERATDVADEAVELERVLERVREAKRLRIVILDACRNNPFLSRMVMAGGRARAVQRGLADIEPEHGEVVFYAARHGTTAEDGANQHSPFTTALLKHLGTEGLEISLFFRKVTSDVLASTTPKQQPFVYGSIPADDFYFIPPKSTP